MNLPFEEEIVKLLFEPERLIEIHLNEPEKHLRYIQAYAQLEFQEGYWLGIMYEKEVQPLFEKTVDFLVHSIRMNKMENLLAFYEESKKSTEKYGKTLFFVCLHKANKVLNRYPLPKSGS